MFQLNVMVIHGTISGCMLKALHTSAGGKEVIYTLYIILLYTTHPVYLGFSVENSDFHDKIVTETNITQTMHTNIVQTLHFSYMSRFNMIYNIYHLMPSRRSQILRFYA